MATGRCFYKRLGKGSLIIKQYIKYKKEKIMYDVIVIGAGVSG